MLDALFQISIQTVKSAIPNLRLQANALLKGGVEALQEKQTPGVQAFLEAKQSTYPQLITEGSKNFILGTALSEVEDLETLVLDPNNREKLLELDPSELKDLSKILLAYAVAINNTVLDEIAPEPQFAVEQLQTITNASTRFILAANLVLDLIPERLAVGIPEPQVLEAISRADRGVFQELLDDELRLHLLKVQLGEGA